MRKTLTIASREIAAFFFSPMAYVIAAVFLLVSGALFFYDTPLQEAIFRPGGEASLRPLLNLLARLMVLTAPLLTMRLVSDELRSGTIETLTTAPVTDAQVILGKFLGVMVCYAALLATTVVHLAVMAAFGRPDWAIALLGYAGLLLLGAAFVSVGLFASTLTQYQILAAVTAMAILAVFSFVAPQLAMRLGPPYNHAAAALNAMRYFEEFSKGVLDARGLWYFLSGTGLFLFLSTLTLESRRWR